MLASLTPHLAPGLRTQVLRALRGGLAPAQEARVLADVLIANGEPLPEEVLRGLDEARGAREMHVEDEPVETRPDAVVARVVAGRDKRVVVLRGDITTLKVDAVVNAANEGGLGCFQPRHRCVDNVIHRAAGPRLREACREGMLHHPSGLGPVPMVTPGFRLPARYVMHVVGPQLGEDEDEPTLQHRRALQLCYANVLKQAMNMGLASVAFPCISTGLFRYPQEAAVGVAMDTALRVLNHPSTADHTLRTVVFVVFTDRDEALYREALAQALSAGRVAALEQVPATSWDTALARARAFVAKSKRVLICAGAGMSVKDAASLENVYVDPAAFKHHYPFMLQHGYQTAYECMGLLGDLSVPDRVKWGFFAKHWDNMRWGFTPNESYAALRDLVKDKDVFVFTSNVDGCFVRAGFDPARVYTPQGQWDYLQCMRPCRRDAFFPSRPVIDRLLQGRDPSSGEVRGEDIPTCPFCEGPVWGCVRGASWFLHTPYDQHGKAFMDWIQAGGEDEEETVILEIGAGFNTPTVTRFPMEALARQVPGFRLVRVNPDDATVPADLERRGVAVSLKVGHAVVRELGGNQANGARVSVSAWRGRGRGRGGGDEEDDGESWRDFLEALC